MREPKPKATNVVCDVCGLDWAKHKPAARGKVTVDECVRLLKEEAARAASYPWQGNYVSRPVHFTSMGRPPIIARGIPIN